MLTKLADGLVARQDPETGCWYQLLQYGPEKCATQGVDETGSAKYTNVSEGGTQCNYLESSASCLITAALLKGSRLGLIDHAEAGKKGFEGILRTFVRQVPSDEVPSTKEILTITGSCQSAGLSHDRLGNAAYYLIGKDVPIQDNTEGKVLGTHKGFWNYTIGQRRGLKISADEPLYVIELRKDTNEVVIGPKDKTMNDTLVASNLNWIIEPTQNTFKAQAKIRSTQQPAGVEVTLDSDRIIVKFDDMQKSIAIGQSVVLYDNDLVLGGGIISEVK
jgi:hypothetical protein